MYGVHIHNTHGSSQSCAVSASLNVEEVCLIGMVLLRAAPETEVKTMHFGLSAVGALGGPHRKGSSAAYLHKSSCFAAVYRSHHPRMAGGVAREVALLAAHRQAIVQIFSP